ncbi:uncharacterized protein BDV14DRAFT_197432 [Aspergillus stella-maris]|uniref:uncharacterized protein n=1 Tax=Aspergillus stella-maris TaxID=1810926 RepID=UPI003CCCE490
MACTNGPNSESKGTEPSSTCEAKESTIHPLAQQIARIIKSRSNGHTCDAITSTWKDYKFEYHATGRNCDTLAPEWATSGMIFEHLMRSGRLCNHLCMRLDNRGDWRGYLKLAVIEGEFDKVPACDEKTAVPICTWGEVKGV